MTILELTQMLDAHYPRTLSCPWDSDGLMVAEAPERAVRRVLLALDATEDAIRYAAETGCEVLLTHHPMLFRPLSAVTPLSLSGRRTWTAIRAGVAVLSYHTRLDAGEGGVNDTLAEKLGLHVLSSFGDEESPTLGRVAELEAEMSPDAFAAHVRQALGCPYVAVTGTHPVRRVALVGGDGKSLIRAAAATGADTFLTGAAGYNAALDAAEAGMNILEAGHYHTEAPVLERLATLCREAGAEVVFFDSNPTRAVVG